MLKTTLFSTSNIKPNKKNNKFEFDLNLDEIFISEAKNNYNYLRYQSIEDWEITQLKDVINSKEKINMLCDSALNSNFEINENIFENVNIKDNKNIVFDINEKEQLINKKISKIIGNKKIKKSDDQIKILEEEKKKNPFWDKNKILELSKKLELPFYSIYKWKWDNSFML